MITRGTHGEPGILHPIRLAEWLHVVDSDPQVRRAEVRSATDPVTRRVQHFGYPHAAVLRGARRGAEVHLVYGSLVCRQPSDDDLVILQRIARTLGARCVSNAESKRRAACQHAR